MMHRRRVNSALFSVLALTALLASPHPARAGNFFDFLFGGFQQRPTPPADVNSYAAPSASIDRVAPASPFGIESVRQDGGNIGRTVAFCVRQCDGHQFPMDHLANTTPVETCRAMCPASKTKVFFGGEISTSVAKDGQRYADSDNAFLYRKQLVANCTCNGKDAFGLAPFDMTKDPTLRPGDIVATKDGFVAYSGAQVQGGPAAFTPIESSVVAAQLNPYAPRARLARSAEAPPADDPGTIVPAQSLR
jgi:Protein of unknown function (DUF2865)